MIKHGEITALEDSIAAPEKLNQQYMAKKYPKYPNFWYLLINVINLNNWFN